MGVKLTAKIPLIIAVVTGFAFAGATVTAQSNAARAKEHFERAMSYRATDDPRAEEEFKQAIANRGGKYAEAWEGLSRYLTKSLRFKEAAAAWRKYLKQNNEKASPYDLDQLKRLDRGALLKSRSDNGQVLTINEALELINLVDGYGSKGDAVLYAEKAVQLYPESGKALVALSRLIEREQQDRAWELLNRAIAFGPNDPTFYVARGRYFFWVRGNSPAASADFRKAIELSDGTNASAWAGLGDSLAREGHRDEAIEAYRMYLSIRPKSAAHYDGEIRKSIELLESGPSKP